MSKSDSDALRKRVTELESRLAVAEARIAMLEARPPAILPPVFAPAPAVPMPLNPYPWTVPTCSQNTDDKGVMFTGQHSVVS